MPYTNENKQPEGEGLHASKETLLKMVEKIWSDLENEGKLHDRESEHEAKLRTTEYVLGLEKALSEGRGKEYINGLLREFLDLKKHEERLKQETSSAMNSRFDKSAILNRDLRNLKAIEKKLPEIERRVKALSEYDMPNIQEKVRGIPSKWLVIGALALSLLSGVFGVVLTNKIMARMNYSQLEIKGLIKQDIRRTSKELYEELDKEKRNLNEEYDALYNEMICYEGVIDNNFAEMQDAMNKAHNDAIQKNRENLEALSEGLSAQKSYIESGLQEMASLKDRLSKIEEKAMKHEEKIISLLDYRRDIISSKEELEAYKAEYKRVEAEYQKTRKTLGQLIKIVKSKYPNAIEGIDAENKGE